MNHLYTFLLVLSSYAALGQLSIGTPTPDPSAQLEINSVDKGLLIPRVTLANRPGSPGKAPAVAGLLVYQTDQDPGFYAYTKNGWEKMIHSSEARTSSYFSGTRVKSESIALEAKTFGCTPVSFDSLTYSSDIHLDPSKSTVTLTKAGTYQITYSVTPSSSTTHYFTHLIINNSIISHLSTMGQTSRPNTSGNHIVKLSGNTTLQLALGSGLVPFSGSVHFMNGFHIASLTIVKID